MRNIEKIKIEATQVNYIYIYFFIVLILTYVLPENILQILTPLQWIVNLIADIFPSIAKLGRYSAFPQVAQIVYALCIITLPATCIFAYKISKKEINKDPDAMKKRNIPGIVVLGIICITIALLVIIFGLPGNPAKNEYYFLTDWIHNSKFGFSFNTSLVFLLFVVSLAEVVVTARLNYKK